MAVLLALGLAGCSGIPVPEAVDDAARGYGLQLDADRKYPMDLNPGDCMEEPPEGEIMALRVIDCSEEHGSEMVHHATVPAEDGEYPGDDSPVWMGVDDECIQAYDDYLGEDFMSSAWDFGVIAPDELTWESGDQTAQCLLLHVEARTWSGSPRTGDVELLELFGSGTGGDTGEGEPDEDSASA